MLANTVRDSIGYGALEPKTMSISAKYRIVSKIGSEETDSFRAREVATGNPVSCTRSCPGGPLHVSLI